jgi:hypothetical protein
VEKWAATVEIVELKILLQPITVAMASTLLQLPLSVVTINPALVAVHKVVVCIVKLLMFSVLKLGGDQSPASVTGNIG